MYQKMGELRLCRERRRLNTYVHVDVKVEIMAWGTTSYRTGYIVLARGMISMGPGFHELFREEEGHHEDVLTICNRF